MGIGSRIRARDDFDILIDLSLAQVLVSLRSAMRRAERSYMNKGLIIISEMVLWFRLNQKAQ